MGSALGFLGARMAQRTVDAVERKIVWGGTGAVLVTTALVFLLIAAYQYLLPNIGAVASAGLLGLICGALGILAFFAPKMLSWLEKQSGQEEIDPMKAIHQEAHAAVDQFGPYKVGLTAFMLGLSAGRGVRGAVRR
jgi:hypothetical protein